MTIKKRNRGPSTPPSLSKVRMAQNIEPEYVSVVDAEIATGISRWYWRTLAYSGQVECVKIGSSKNGRLVIPIREVRRVMQRYTIPVNAELPSELPSFVESKKRSLSIGGL